ncbi:MAG TPA: cytosine permease [Baekduia sp.]|nr:cytosine permease [Baekduia sp.]
MAVAQEQPVGTKPTGVEQRSIDWVTNEERGGKLSSLGAVWFVGNINLTAMATGVAALSIGASLFWTVVATVLGSLFGTFFMAFHSAQGPQLGLPQLVQSRPQFGYLGAAISIFVFALVNYIAYNTSDALLSGSAMHDVFHVPTALGFPLAALIAALLAIYGYHWIHRINRWLAWPSVILMVVLTIAAFADSSLPSGAFSPGDFQLAPFMTVFVIIAGFQLGWAPYVSDYSRYLPARVSVRSTFWWTYGPSALSGLWVFCLGAIISAAAPDATPVGAFKAAGNSLFDGFGDIAVVGLLIGLLAVMAINAYGGSLSMISIADSFGKIRPTRALRIATVIAMGVLVWCIAQFVGEDNFNKFYGNVLIFLAYIFTPWTAINLVDFFFIRRGVYVIGEIFKPDGIYGRWGWRGLTAYVVGIGAMVPFFVTSPFTGPLAKALSSVDYSIFVGLPVAGLLYLWLCRDLDLAGELRLAEDEGVLDLHHLADHLPGEDEGRRRVGEPALDTPSA